MVLTELVALLGFEVDRGSWDKANHAIGGLTAKLGLASLTLGGLWGTLTHLVKEEAADAAGMARMAKQVGLSTERYSEMESAAKLAGLATGDIGFYMTRLAYSATAAARGHGELARQFRSIGLDARSMKNAKPDEVLLRVTDAFNKMPDGMAKINMARVFFGRGGQEMIRFMGKGREGIEQAIKLAHEFGVVETEESAKAASAFNYSLRVIKMAMDGLKKTIAEPLMTRTSKQLQDLAEWIRKNRKAIAKWVDTLSRGLAWAFEHVTLALEPMVDLLKWIAAHPTVMWALFGVLALTVDSLVLKLLVLVAVIEDIWGWVTGKRHTLLERMFGSFDEVKKMPMIEYFKDAFLGMKLFIQDAADAWRGFIGMFNGDNERYWKNAVAIQKNGFMAAGGDVSTNMDKQMQLARDPRFSYLANHGMYADILKEYGPGMANAPVDHAPIRGSVVQIGNITLHLPPSQADVDSQAKAAAEAVHREMTRVNQEAAAAGAR